MNFNDLLLEFLISHGYKPYTHNETVMIGNAYPYVVRFRLADDQVWGGKICSQEYYAFDRFYDRPICNINDQDSLDIILDFIKTAMIL